LGNPIASPNDIPYWCFFVEDQYTINGSDTGQATQKPNLPITPVPTPTPSSEYIYIPYDEIPSEPGYTIMAMAWRPDSSMVAIVYDYLNTGLTPVSPSASHLYFYDSSTGELINKMDDLHEPTVKDLVWSPDGDEIATLDIQGRLIVRNYETNAVVVDYDLQLYNWILDWSDKGNYLAVGSLLGVVIFETNDWKEIHRLEVYDSTARPFLDFIPHLEISPSGERIAIIKLHKELTMWDIKTGEMINKREGNFQDFTWNPKSDTLAATVLKKGNGGPDYDTVYYDENLESGWKLSFTGPISISWNPTNDNYLSVGAFDETSESAQIYDLTTLKPVMNFNQYERIYSLIWSPDGSKLVGRGETGIYIFPIDNLLP
jgi:WD40 repeat protein